NGEGNSDILTNRMDVLKSLQDLDKLDSMEMAQKTRIKWAIEGDENLKYYYGVLNKKKPTCYPRRFWTLMENDVVEVVLYFFQYGQFPKAFVANRQILDDPFILNELFQWCKKKNNQTMIFKVNFEKAYDSVRWDYLDDILKKFGFGNKWCGWIRNCLISSKGSVIVNGSPTKEFQFHKGLKQGDPLFPFLFILIMQSLHISMQRVMDADMFRGIKLGPSLQVSHLFYADDAVFMGHWSDSNIYTILRLFLDISVQRVMDASSLPIYHMLLFKVPSKVLHKIESIRCHFFNGVEHNGKKHIWVKWSKVLASKEKGGLGVSSLYALNRALLFKWVWRFHTQQSSLWTKVIKGIHGVDGKLGKHVKNHHPSIWLDIVREVHQLQNHDIDLMGFILKKIGKGEDALFWEDAWRGDNNFKSLYHRMYALETQKNVIVASKMSHVDMSSSFRRAPRGGSEES
ncbi:RNA-directed DNA polymerase, eukaryota, reverse transcriptase zinc-binding domain protein, partial [Tanacetum coccineum]